MSGYRPWMAGAKEAAIRANKAQAARHRAEQRQRYDEYRAESRACGYEVESFEEWLGEKSARQAAEDRMGYQDRSLEDRCYYGDRY
jgi:predicted phage gp36 major capsid-like protein